MDGFASFRHPRSCCAVRAGQGLPELAGVFANILAKMSLRIRNLQNSLEVVVHTNRHMYYCIYMYILGLPMTHVLVDDRLGP